MKWGAIMDASLLLSSFLEIASHSFPRRKLEKQALSSLSQTHHGRVMAVELALIDLSRPPRKVDLAVLVVGSPIC